MTPSTNTLLMEKGKAYHVKITSIQDGRKPVGGKYKYFILGHNQAGKEFKAEFLLPEGAVMEPQDRDEAVAAEFPIGIMRWIRCYNISQLGTYTIEPCEPPGSDLNREWRQTMPMGLNIPKDDAGIPLPYRPPCSSVNVAGSSLAFSVAYAKDLMVAEVGEMDGDRLTDKDIDRLLGWADKINKWLCDKIGSER